MSTEARRKLSNKNKRFHFEALRLASEECHEVIKTSWDSWGSASITTRIAQCATDLSKWAAASFGGIKKRIKEVKKELSVWQKGQANAVMLQKCGELTEELDELHRKEETYWHARARASELRDGEKTLHTSITKQVREGRGIRLYNSSIKMVC